MTQSPERRLAMKRACEARRRAQVRGLLAAEREKAASKLPEGPWSDHGKRVAAAIAELEAHAVRALLASGVEVDDETDAAEAA